MRTDLIKSVSPKSTNYRFRRLFFLAALVLIMVTPALANAEKSPEDILSLCIRDGKNMARKVTREMDEWIKDLEDAKSNPRDLKREAKRFRNGHDSLNRYHKRCVKEKRIQGLDGYNQVTTIYRQTKKHVDKAFTKAETLTSTSVKESMSAGPGAGYSQTSTRWDNRPKRCKGENPWQEIESESHRGIAGANEIEDGAKPSKVEKLVASLVCGKGIRGIDKYPDEKRNWNDIRSKLADAIIDEETDDNHRAIYQGLIAYACFYSDFRDNIEYGHKWDLQKDYSTWMVCSQSLNKSKLGNIGSAFDSIYPGRDFEKANILYLAKLGQKGKKSVDSAFRKFERKYPLLKKIYWNSRIDGMKKWRKRRNKYRSAYKVLDPITEQLSRDIDGTPPSNCVKKLIKLRSIIEKEIKPKNENDVRAIRASHPLGYQITEALSWCYLANGNLAKSYQEANSLRYGFRQVTIAEAAYFAVKQSEINIQQKLSKALLEKKLPGFNWPYHIPLPPSTFDNLCASRFAERVKERASFKLIGEKKDEPTVIASIKSKGKLAHLKFKRLTWKINNDKIACSDSDKIDHYEVSGNRVVPHYQQNCIVIERRWLTITYQAKPIYIPREDAALLKKGLWVELLVNENDSKDVALSNAYSVKKRKKGRQRVISGIRLR